MKKYFIAGLIGLGLFATQAAASDDMGLQWGDRVGSHSDKANHDTGPDYSYFVLIALGAAAIGYGLSQDGTHHATNVGNPASP